MSSDLNSCANSDSVKIKLKDIPGRYNVTLSYTGGGCFASLDPREISKTDWGIKGAKFNLYKTTCKGSKFKEWKNKSGSFSPEPSTPTDPTTPTDPADPAKPTDPTEQTKLTDTATDSSKQVTAEDSTAAINAEEKAENINKKQKNTSISKLKAGKKSITISWKKLTAKDIKGYEIQYSTDKAFKKDVKTVNIGKTKRTSKTIKKLTSKKKYYVRIRTYKKSGGEKIYSKWSKSKSVKVK